MDEMTTVRNFLAALEAFDIDTALLVVDDEIVYQNNNLPAAKGRKAFESQIRAMTRFGDHFEARIDHIAQDGTVVLTRRTEVIGMQHRRITFWAWGAFDVRDGRIVDWHDYFDWAQVSGRTATTLPAIGLNWLRNRVGA